MWLAEIFSVGPSVRVHPPDSDHPSRIFGARHSQLHTIALVRMANCIGGCGRTSSTGITDEIDADKLPTSESVRHRATMIGHDDQQPTASCITEQQSAESRQ